MSRHLSELEGVLVVAGVEAVGGDDFGPELSLDGVGGQAEHVYLHVGALSFLGQELAGNDLGGQGRFSIHPI